MLSLNAHKLDNSMTYTVTSFSMFILSLNSDEPSANPWVQLMDKLIRCHGDGQHVIYMAKQLRSTTSLNVEVNGMQSWIHESIILNCQEHSCH